MGIELKESGFYEWGEKRKKMLGVDSARLDECVAYYHAAKFRGLFGNPGFGFDQDNLDFLGRMSDADNLWFWDVKLRDIEGLYELEGLKSMGINDKRPGIDFTRFPVLRSAINHWIKKDHGIAKSKMAEYILWHFKPRSKSFEGLEIPLGVKRLEFNWANPASLADLPVLKKLKEIQFHRCRNLADLSELPRVAPNLERLLTTTSSRIDATAGVVDHPKLKEALIDGRFVVGEAE